MPFQNVLGEPAKKRMSPKEVGCEFCPLNKIPGIHKVMGEVHGREVFVWGMAPGPNENDEPEEFVGKSGKLLWQELKRVGITRHVRHSKCGPMLSRRPGRRQFPRLEDA